MAASINRRDFLKTSAAGAGAISLGAGGPATHASAQTPIPAFPGTDVMPDDLRYPTLARGFNLRWVGTPAYIAVCGDTAEVVGAVQRALDDGRRITVRGGGHCFPTTTAA